MPDRDNIEDVFYIIKEDFNWIAEDMEQHRKILKNKLINFVKEEILFLKFTQKKKFTLHPKFFCYIFYATCYFLSRKIIFF